MNRIFSGEGRLVCFLNNFEKCICYQLPALFLNEHVLGRGEVFGVEYCYRQSYKNKTFNTYFLKNYKHFTNVTDFSLKST